MSTESNIHPKLAEIITGNVGNTITPELATGILAKLQALLAEVASQAFAAGQEAERPQEQAEPEPTNRQQRRKAQRAKPTDVQPKA